MKLNPCIYFWYLVFLLSRNISKNKIYRYIYTQKELNNLYATLHGYLEHWNKINQKWFTMNIIIYFSCIRSRYEWWVGPPSDIDVLNRYQDISIKVQNPQPLLSDKKRNANISYMLNIMYFIFKKRHNDDYRYS